MRPAPPSPSDRPQRPAPADRSRAAWRRDHAASGVTSRLIVAYVERAGGAAAVAELLERAGMAGREPELRDENAWFSFAEKILLWEAAEAVSGDPQIALHVGESALELSVGIGLKCTLRALGTPDLVYRNILRANAKFNWAHTLSVERRERGRTTLVYDDVCGVGYHHHDCQYTIGLLRTVPQLFGLPAARVEHRDCGARGAARCTYDVSWSTGVQGTKRAGVIGAALTAAVASGAGLTDPALIGWGVGLAGLTVGAIGMRLAAVLQRRVDALQAQARDQDAATSAQLQSLAALSSELRLDRALDQIMASATGAIAGAQFALLVTEPGRMGADRCSEIPERFVRRLERWAQENRDPLRDGSLVLDNLEHVPGLSALAADERMPLASACAAPLRFGEELLGVLVALAPGANVFLPNDVRSLEIYAGHAAIALWNARLVAQLEREAAEDPLTGVANRRVLGLACDVEIARAAREGGTVSLIMIDLDHFKRINDTYGHPFGDEVLVKVAERLRSVVRGQDTVARLGGEEFALLLPGAGTAEAHEVAERARALLAAIEMPCGTLSCSAGVSSLGAEITSRGDLLSAADRALYDAKRRGRGRTVLAPAAAV